MKNCFFLLFFSMQLLCAQKVLVLDKSSKEIIPFANLVSDSTVVYSNENGVLDLATFNKDEYIKISAIGYKSQEMYRSKIADTILLKPIDNVLDEIVVISDKKDTETTKKLSDSKKLGNQVIFCHTNIITKVSSYSNLKEKKIISITIPFDRHSGLSKKQKEIFSKSKLNLRLNILKVNGDSLGDLIYSSSIKNILTGKIDELTFSTKELNLKFSEDGFYLQLENLGAVDENGEFITCNNGLFMARVKISDKESKEYKIESYRLAKNGSVDLEKQLNYTQSFGKNDLDKNYFLNYRFKYYE